jgi:hypothetical protein
VTPSPAAVPQNIIPLRSKALQLLEAERNYMQMNGCALPMFYVQSHSGRFNRFFSQEYFRPSGRSKAKNPEAVKEAGFVAIRDYIHMKGATGCIFIAEGWRFERPISERDSIVDVLVTGISAGEDPNRREVLVATLQTPTHVLVMWQPFSIDSLKQEVVFGELQEDPAIPQERFRGRQKMFGNEEEGE